MANRLIAALRPFAILKPGMPIASQMTPDDWLNAINAARAAIAIEEGRETRRKLKAMNNRVARGLADGTLTLDGKPSR